MLFTTPEPFDEAIRSLQSRGLLPTSASSRQLRGLSSQVRELAIFSARTTDARYLAVLQDISARLASPETIDGRPAEPGEYINPAKARELCQEGLRAIGARVIAARAQAFLAPSKTFPAIPALTW